MIDTLQTNRKYTKEDRDVIETNYVIQMVQPLAFAEIMLNAWQEEPFVKGDRKKQIQAFLDRINRLMDLLCDIIPPKHMAELKDKVIPADVVTDVIALQTYMMALPKGIRANLIKYADSMFSTYALNK